MATIRSQMALNDGMSAVLKKITRVLDTTVKAFEDMQAASGQAVDTQTFQDLHTELAEANNGIAQMEKAYEQAARAAESLDDGQQQFNDSVNQGSSALDGLVGKITAAVAAYASVSKIKSLITDGLEAVDTKIGVQVQLSTVMGNMGTGDYYDEVLEKASEIQSKGIYSDDVMLAGAAELATYFSDAEALISMMDTLSNYAMGMSGGGELDTTAMTDYATGIGKIMTGSYDAMTKKGFEFSDVQKSIIEGTATEAEIVAELGADYLGLSQDMQAAAVIADVIDESWAGLYETMSSTPEGQIISFNNSLGDLQETIGLGVYPAVLNLVSVFQAYLPQIQSAAEGLAAGLSTILNVLSVLIEAALSFGTVVANNWSWIEPIIWGVVAALIAYNAVQGIGWLTTLKDIAAKTAHAVASAAETAAIIALMIAQDGLNAAMAACPITWIITAVIALIAVIVAVVRATNLWGAESTSVLGTITGLFAVAVAFIGNLLISLWNTVVDIFVLIYNFIGGIAVGIGTLFNDPVAGVIQLFYTLADTVLGVLETLASAIDTLFGSNLAGAVQGWRSSLKSWTEDTFGVEVWEGIDGDALKIDRINYGDAFSFGSSLGDGISDSIGSLFDTETLNVEDYVGGSAVTDFTLDDIASDTSSIADSASGIEDSLDISNEELSYLRDIAERDAINRFTTAEIQIDMTGMTNRIESDADLDGIISAFTDGFSEALLTAAEGVHA